MMRLYILRHAEAVDTAATDFDRELTPHGVEQAKRVAKFLRTEGLRPDAILTSPYLRTLQTAEYVGKEVGLTPVPEERLGCGMTAETGLGLIRGQANSAASLLLVGHQPDLGELMDALLGVTGSGGGSVHVKKASLACFWLHRVGVGGATLEFFIPAKYLKG